MMQLLNPMFLVWLVGLLVPVIIHLWSRNTRKSVGFGSLKFLRETETRTMRSLLPSQLLLLILRLALLVVLILFLTAPYYESQPDSKRQIVVVDPIYQGASWLNAIKDTSEYMYWLGTDFPKAEDEINPPLVENYWEALNGLTRLIGDEIIVFSPLPIVKFKGPRLPIPDNVTWYSPDYIKPVGDPLIFSKGDQHWIAETTSNEKITRFDLKKSEESGQRLEVLYHIHSDSEQKASAELMQLALESIQDSNPLLSLREVSLEDASLVIWFSDDPAPKAPLTFQLNEHQSRLLENKGSGSFDIHPSAFSSKGIIKAGFLPRLEQMLFDYCDPNLPDNRTMPLKQLATGPMEAEASLVISSLSKYLWLIFVLLLVTERWVSIKG